MIELVRITSGAMVIGQQLSMLYGELFVATAVLAREDVELACNTRLILSQERRATYCKILNYTDL